MWLLSYNFVCKVLTKRLCFWINNFTMTRNWCSSFELWLGWIKIQQKRYFNSEKQERSFHHCHDISSFKLDFFLSMKSIPPPTFCKKDMSAFGFPYILQTKKEHWFLILFASFNLYSPHPKLCWQVYLKVDCILFSFSFWFLVVTSLIPSRCV